MIKKTLIFLSLFMSISLFSQQLELDKYQYIIVQSKLEFLKSADQFQTSSLLKFLLKKKGFTVFMSNEKLPQNLNNNRCLSLSATILDNSSMLSIKNTIELKDCYGKVLYTSKVGKSRNKDYKKGYHEAIRSAFGSMTDFEYNSNTAIASKKEVTADKDLVVVDIIATPKVVKTPSVKTEIVVSNDVDMLYAQVNTNGYQLINTKPEVVFVILKTNVKNVFVIKDKNGVFYKVGEIWVAEYYENTELIEKQFQVKF
jgi:hypothetical protein